MVGLNLRFQNALLVRNDEENLHIKNICHMCLMLHVVPWVQSKIASYGVLRQSFNRKSNQDSLDQKWIIADKEFFSDDIVDKYNALQIVFN